MSALNNGDNLSISPDIKSEPESDCDCSECEDGPDSEPASSNGPTTKRRKVVDPTKPPRIFHCNLPGCTQTFMRKHQLKAHHRTAHPIQVQLDVAASDDQTASGKGPMACRFDGCGKTFQTACHLLRHELIHSNKRPFRCKWDGCTFVAIQRSDAIRHVRVKHFQLPRTYKLQQEQGIHDDRDPLQFIEINNDE